MKDQIVMSPNNAQLAVAIPLFRLYKNDSIVAKIGYELTMIWPEPDPLAYVIDCGAFYSVLSAEWVEENLIFLGEL